MTHKHTHTCAIAGMLNIFGDHWTWLVVREAFYGATRFKDFQRNTGISRNLLADRLSVLVDEGIFKKTDIGTQGTRFAYELTDKGQSLQPVLAAMTLWGNEHVFGAGNEPVLMVDQKSGLRVEALHPVNAKGRKVLPENVIAMPGPGASKATIRRLEEAAAQDGS
ncbi:helix-turn-helix domain-containing protein [Pyruvatibacter sp.]|uniref:winged helix-turn-helix transcriptional regulator n=1 Tax=Pyruvatibacter sp. TaxID=1981328 RepID=UPI0032654A71